MIFKGLFLPKPFYDSMLFLQCHRLILAYKWSPYSLSFSTLRVVISVMFSQHSLHCLPGQKKEHLSACTPWSHHGEAASGLPCT